MSVSQMPRNRLLFVLFAGFSDMGGASDTTSNLRFRGDLIQKPGSSNHSNVEIARLVLPQGNSTSSTRRLADVPTEPRPNKFLSIDVDNQGYDAAVAGVGIAVGAWDLATGDKSLGNAGKLVASIGEILPMLTIITAPWGLVAGVALGAVGSIMQAHDASPEKDPNTKAILDAMKAGFDEVNRSVREVIDITTETLELVRENNLILQEELRLEFSTLRDINDLYREAQKQYKQLASLREDEQEWNHRLSEFKKPLRKAMNFKVDFYGNLDGDHFSRTLHLAIQKTQDTGTFCETGNRVQWYIGTRQQLYWLLIMDAQFNEDPARLRYLVNDYTHDLVTDMNAYDRHIKAWGSNYLYYAIKVSYAECASLGIGYNCNHGRWEGNQCKCYGNWGSRGNGFIDTAVIGSDAGTSTLIDGSLKADCYYRPYSCPNGKDVHLYTGTYSRHYRSRVGMFKHSSWSFWDYYELRTDHQYPWSCGECEVWKIYPDGSGKFGLHNAKYGWLKHTSEQAIEHSGAFGDNEKWLFVQVGLSKDQLPYDAGTNFERMYIKHGDRFLMQENDMGQVQYKVMNGGWPDYRATFHIAGTDGTKCGPELVMYAQPDLLEPRRVPATRLPFARGSGTIAPVEWMLSSGTESCAEACASHQLDCTEDHWHDVSTRSSVDALFRKLGKNCASFAEVPEADAFANWRPYICVGDSCCGDGSCNMQCTYTQATSVQRCHITPYWATNKRLCPCVQASSAAAAVTTTTIV